MTVFAPASTSLRHTVKSVSHRLAARAIERSPHGSRRAQLLGRAAGLKALFTTRRDWGHLAQAAAELEPNSPSWKFILRYCMQQGADNAWCVALSEIENHIEKYVQVPDLSLLRDRPAQAPGAILLSAHFGPMAYFPLLRTLGLDRLRMLLTADNIARFREACARVPAGLRTRQAQMKSDQDLVWQSHGQEWELLQHLRSGGLALIYLDDPDKRASSISVRFLNSTLDIGTFPLSGSAAPQHRNVPLPLRPNRNWLSPQSGPHAALRHV